MTWQVFEKFLLDIQPLRHVLYSYTYFGPWMGTYHLQHCHPLTSKEGIVLVNWIQYQGIHDIIDFLSFEKAMTMTTGHVPIARTQMGNFASQVLPN